MTVHPSNVSFTLNFSQQTQSIQLSYNYYEGWDGEGQRSGAYIFRPKSNTPKTYSRVSQTSYFEGDKHLVFIFEGDTVLSKVYFSKAENYVEKYGFLIESHVDSIPIEDGAGKEVTLNIKTGIKNGDTFFTDSMGLE